MRRGSYTNSRSHKSSILKMYSESISASLVLLLPQIKRSTIISFALMLLYMGEIFGQGLSDKLDLSSIVTSIFYKGLIYLNFRRYSARQRLMILSVSSGLNSLVIISFVTFVVITRKKIQSKHAYLFKFVKTISLNVFKYYYYTVSIPFLNTSISTVINGVNGESGSNSIEIVIAVASALSTTLISIFIINKGNIISYKKYDRLSEFPSTSKYIRKLAVLASCCLCFKDSFFDGIIILLVFCVLFTDYVLCIPYSSKSVSQFYLSLIIFGISASSVFAIIQYDATVQKKMDFSSLLLISFSLAFATGPRIRGKLIYHKVLAADIKNLIDPNLFDLFSRELKELIRLAKLGNDVLSRSELSIILLKHTQSCRNPACECKEIDFSQTINWKKAKKQLLKNMSQLLKSILTDRTGTKCELTLVTYCVFLVDLEKKPKQALHFMYKNKERITQDNNKIMMNVIHENCRQMTMKELRKLQNGFASFSELMLHEKDADSLELRAREFLFKYLEFMVRLFKSRGGDGAAGYSLFALSAGAQLSNTLQHIKHSILTLLNVNPENYFLLRMALTLNALFDEDIEFFSTIKRIEYRRVEIVRGREKHGRTDNLNGADIFNPNAGVIYINLSDRLGYVEQVSSSAANLLNTTKEEMIGHNISKFMPAIISKLHDELLSNFVHSDKAALIREKSVLLFALDQERYLLTVNLNIRIDTYFSSTFLMSGLITKQESDTSALICDENGLILNYTQELEEKLHLKSLKKEIPEFAFNICVLMPQFYYHFYPENDKNQRIVDRSDELSEIKVIFFQPPPNGGLKEKRLISQGLDFDESPKSMCRTFGDSRSLVNSKTIKEEPKKQKDLLFSMGYLNVQKSSVVYKTNLNLKTMNYKGGEIKIVYLTFNEISEIDDYLVIHSEKETHLKNLNIFRSTYSINKSPTNKSPSSKSPAGGKKPISFQGNFISFESRELIPEETFEDEKEPHEKSANLEENLNEDDSKSSRSLRQKNNIRTYTVQLPNSNKNELISNANHAIECPSEEISAVIPIEIPLKSTERKLSIYAKTLEIPLMKQMENSKKFESFVSGVASISSDYEFREQRNKGIFENEGLKILEDCARSENSSNVSTQSYFSRIKLLEHSNIHEIKALITIRAIIFVAIFTLIGLTWFTNTNNQKTIEENIISSIIIKDINLQMNFLMKDFLIDEFKTRGLFDESNDTDGLFEYISLDLAQSKDGIKSIVHDKLPQNPSTSTFLHNREIELKNFSFSDFQVNSKMDLKSCIGVLLASFSTMENGETADEGLKVRDFILNNFSNFIENILLTFNDLKVDIFESLNYLKSFGINIIIILTPSLFLIYLYVFRCGYKIRYGAYRLGQALMNFDKTIMSLKIEEISKFLLDIYPEANMQVKLLVADVRLIHSKAATKAHNHKKEYVKTTTAKSQNTSQRRVNRNLENTEINEFSQEYQRNEERKKYELTSSGRFYIILLMGLTFILALTLSIFVMNFILIIEFQSKVKNMITMNQGIQIFTTSAATKIVLKHLSYNLLSGNKTEKTSQLLDDLDQQFKIIDQNIALLSDPKFFLNEQQKSAELSQLSSDFYLENICSLVDKYKLPIDFTYRFNYQHCGEVFQGVLKRGLKFLIIEINNLIVEWDAKLLISQEDPSSTLKHSILNSPLFGYLQYATRILVTVEGSINTRFSNFSHEIIDNFHLGQNLWIAFSLPIISISLIYIWMDLLARLRKIYLFSILMLKNFPTKMIGSNKILLARMDEIFRKI